MKPVIGVPSAVLAQSFQEIQDSGTFADGKFTVRFENEVSRWCGQEAVAFNSCGTALIAVLWYYTNRRVRRWAVQNNTFYATGAAVYAAGGSLRLIDCDPKTFCMSYDELKKTLDIDGVILTHVGGSICSDYRKIADMCRDRGWVLVEDAAHCVGAINENSKRAGDLGDAAVLSFYPTKAVPIGDGGAVITRHDALATHCFRFRNYAKYTNEEGRVAYDRSMLGQNYRISEFNAAIGYHQMKRLTEILDLRNYDAYKLMEVCRPLLPVLGLSNWYKFIVSSEYPSNKKTGQVYARSDQLDMALIGGAAGTFPGSQTIAESHICLPIGEGAYKGMSSGDIERMLFE